MLESQPSVVGIAHCNLSVSDLQRSAEWYQRVMGLRVFRELPDQGGGAKVILTNDDRSLVLGLTGHRSNAGERFSEFGTGLDHFAFAVRDSAELERWLARFAQCGVEHSSIKPSVMGSLITFRDPDNIQLEVYAPPDST